MRVSRSTLSLPRSVLQKFLTRGQNARFREKELQRLQNIIAEQRRANSIDGAFYSTRDDISRVNTGRCQELGHVKQRNTRQGIDRDL